MKHYLKLILGGLVIAIAYLYLLFSELIADKFSLQVIGLFVVPLALSLVVIGFIERYYRGKDKDLN